MWLVVYELKKSYLNIDLILNRGSEKASNRTDALDHRRLVGQGRHSCIEQSQQQPSEAVDVIFTLHQLAIISISKQKKLFRGKRN